MRISISIASCMLFWSILDSASIHVPADQPTTQVRVGAAGDGDTVPVVDKTYTGVGNRIHHTSLTTWIHPYSSEPG
jgi:hypothetical protein